VPRDKKESSDPGPEEITHNFHRHGEENEEDHSLRLQKRALQMASTSRKKINRQLDQGNFSKP